LLMPRPCGTERLVSCGPVGLLLLFSCQ